jgi:hypothetical protein
LENLDKNKTGTEVVIFFIDKKTKKVKKLVYFIF